MGYRASASDIRRGVLAIAATTNFPSGASPQVLNGAAIDVEMLEPNTLSAAVTVTAQTTGITAYAKWQVCNTTGGTWLDFVAANNPANVAIATGTGGVDAAVTKVVAAPAGIEAWKFARIQLYTGDQAATTGDLGGATYSYRENSV